MKLFLTLSLFHSFTFSLSAATLINDTEIERTLIELVEPLADAAGIQRGRLKIYVVNDSDFNAFVRGGEDVFIYTGLLMQISSPSALQAVIAHELGHTLGGHMVQMSERMNSEMWRAMIIQALGVGLMVAGGNPSLGAGVLAGSSGVADASMLSFSRDEERIADDLGVDLMVRAGLNPNGFIEVFTQMNNMMGEMESRVNPNRINHPLTGERLKNVRELIKEKGIRNKEKENNEYNKRYANVRAKLVGYLDTSARVKELYPSSDKSDAAIYARAIANMKGGNLAAAKTGTGTLISRKPKNPYFYELLGDIEYQYGHYDDSVLAYENSLEFSGGAPQIQTALALVLSERNKPDDWRRAADLCRRALLVERTPLTYWVLARVTTGGASDWAMAEYYNMINNKIKTREYAKRAISKLSKDTPEYIKSNDLLR